VPEEFRCVAPELIRVYMLPVAVARFSSDYSAIRYVLLVLADDVVFVRNRQGKGE